MSHSVITLGIDISKACLDVVILPGRRHARYANDEEGIARLVADIPADIAHIVLEPSGGYERPGLAALQQAGLPVSLVNARQIRDFARAKGISAKTDRVDAGVLADYGATFRPGPTPAPGPARGRLQAWLRRRRHMMECLAREKTAREHIKDGDLLSLSGQHVAFLKDQIKTLDEAIERMIEEDGDMARKHAILRSCKSVGPVLASTLLAEMPELGAIDHRKAASLAGLAPRNRDSGAWRGQRRIGGGRAPVRHALYMAAVSASVHNPAIRAFYKKKKAEGKCSKQALVACAHKLLVILNALLRDDRLWQP